MDEAGKKMSNWQDSGFYAAGERIGAFLFANLITAFLLMTVVGAPFGLLGLFALMNEWTQGEQPEFFRVYLGAVRRYGRPALVLGLIDLAGFGLILFNLSVFPLMQLGNFLTLLSLTLTLSLGALLVMANFYAWTVLSLLGLPLRGTIKLSLLLTLSRPLHSLFFTLLALMPLLASLILPVAFLLIVSLSLSAYIAARGVWWALRSYFTREQLAELMEEPAAAGPPPGN